MRRTEQARTRLAAALAWAAFPLYAVQGIRVRLRTPRLLPAAGPLAGRLQGEAPEIRLLVIGESSAAAVGIARMEDGVAARIAQEINQRTGRAVAFRAAGFNSATAAELRDHVVAHVEPRDWTHVVITVGVNDTKNFNTGRFWKKGFGGLLYALRARFPQAELHWCEILPMVDVPALPRPLADILELRARMVNSIARGLCAERGATVVPRMTDLTRDAFCSDGFHPSAAGNAGWAAHIVDFMDFETR